MGETEQIELALFPPPIKCLQRIDFFDTGIIPAFTLAAVLLSGLPDPVLAGFSEPDVSHVLAGDTLLPLRRHQVVRDMFQVRLDAGRTQLVVVPQLAELLGVLLEMALELLALDQLLTDLARTRLLHREPGDRAQRIGHSVSERVNLLHLKVVRFHLVAELRLPLGDLGQHGLVVLGGRERRRLVFAELVGRHDKRQRHAGLACAAGTADAMRVGFRGGGKVEVENACDVLEVNASGDSVIFVLSGCFAALLAGFVAAGGAWLLRFAFVLVAGAGGFAGIVFLRFLGFLRLACPHDLLLVGCDDDVVDALVEFLYNVETGIDREFGVEHAALDTELLEEQLYTVAAIYVADEDDDLSFDQLQFEDDVCQEELFVLGTSVG